MNKIKQFLNYYVLCWFTDPFGRRMLFSVFVAAPIMFLSYPIIKPITVYHERKRKKRMRQGREKHMSRYKSLTLANFMSGTDTHEWPDRESMYSMVASAMRSNDENAYGKPLKDMLYPFTHYLTQRGVDEAKMSILLEYLNDGLFVFPFGNLDVENGIVKDIVVVREKARPVSKY